MNLFWMGLSCLLLTILLPLVVSIFVVLWAIHPLVFVLVLAASLGLLLVAASATG